MIKIDAKGLICPEPIMLLHQAIHESKEGDIVELIATDPTAVKDVKKFCEFLNHSLISYNLVDDMHVFEVKKGT
tara:strand:+ start:2318 stop:2539 length:222 start_codon:yes stop_codon:yes gene_type:complete